jgi:sigma-B regulation protein RsbU (phosphoserine phosphatase)
MPVVVTPIPDTIDGESIGFIYIELRSLAQPWDLRSLTSLFPAVRTLAALVASALNQAETYRDTLDYRAAIQELEFAGRIQSSFLPKELPSLDGWELAVTLLPARETSGDFFDIFQLSDGRVGFLIADVTDKGLGAALYMALSRTLLRTYALEYDEQPDIVFFSANERILQDAQADLFVTAFYGILDQSTGELTYANAGHNPPFLLSTKNGGTIHALATTGMPIGIDEDSSWTQTTIPINPDEVLILYTDGIPDAQNSDGDFFRERQLIEVVQNNLGASAQDIQASILDKVQEFVGDAPQFDDITLLVIARYSERDSTFSIGG